MVRRGQVVVSRPVPSNSDRYYTNPKDTWAGPHGQARDLGSAQRHILLDWKALLTPEYLLRA
jgi:hypothetical protein